MNYSISHACGKSDMQLLCVLSQCQRCRSGMLVMKWEQWQGKEKFSVILSMEGLTKLFLFQPPKQTFCSLMGIAAPGCCMGPALHMVVACDAMSHELHANCGTPARKLLNFKAASDNRMDQKGH